VFIIRTLTAFQVHLSVHVNAAIRKISLASFSLLLSLFHITSIVRVSTFFASGDHNLEEGSMHYRVRRCVKIKSPAQSRTYEDRKKVRAASFTMADRIYIDTLVPFVYMCVCVFMCAIFTFLY